MATAKLLLAQRNGTRRESLTSIKWAWFDQTDPQSFTAPTDTGTLETTDANALIEVTLSGTSLVSGQYGCLALSTSDDVDLGLYKLRLYDTSISFSLIDIGTTYNSIGIAWPIESTLDPTFTASVTVKYKKSSDSIWLNAPNLLRNSYAWFYGTTRPFANREAPENTFAGSLMFLSSNTSYDIQLDYTKGSDTATYSTSISTKAWPEKPTGNTYYIKVGHGGTNSGTSSNPWTSFSAAQATISAGDTVYIGSGTYPGVGYLTTGGNAVAGHIVYEEWPGDEGALISGLAVHADYIWLSGLSFMFDGSFLFEDITAPDQAGMLSTEFKLHSGASTQDDIYNQYAVIIIRSGTGVGQARKIIDYVGSTRVATVDSAWTTQPDNTSVFDLQRNFLQNQQAMSAIRVEAGNSPSYVIVEGCDFTTSNTSLTTPWEYNNNITGRHFQNAVHLIYPGDHWLVCDNNIVGMWDSGAGAGGYTSISTGKGIALGGEGNQGCDNSTVCYNTITQATDAIGISNSAELNYRTHNCDVYGNNIYNNAGNAVSMDGGWANVRVWGNRINNNASFAFSFQPQKLGPWYFLYNQLVGNNATVWKFRTGDRFVQIGNTFNASTLNGELFLKCFMRNNLFISEGSNVWNSLEYWDENNDFYNPYVPWADWYTDIDYDGFDNGGELAMIRWWDNGTQVPSGKSAYYETVPAWGLDVDDDVMSGGNSFMTPEQNAIEVDADLIFVSKTFGNFDNWILKDNATYGSPGNPAIGAGQKIDNLADWWNGGGAPDLGCHNQAAGAPFYGQRDTSERAKILAERFNDWIKH